MNLNLKARLVAAIAQFKASHDIRYYLNGVYVEPRTTGGAVIVATNGHAMGAWLDESAGIDRPAILKVSAKLLTACHGAETNRLTIIDDRLAVVDQYGIEVHIQPEPGKWEVHGKFPNWAAVIGKAADAQHGLQSALNPEYIESMSRALRIGAGSKHMSITTRQRAPHESIVFTSTYAPNFVGVIMPLREDEAPLPKWLTPMTARALMEQRAKDAPLPVHEPCDAGPRDGDLYGWEVVRRQA